MSPRCHGFCNLNFFFLSFLWLTKVFPLLFVWNFRYKQWHAEICSSSAYPSQKSCDNQLNRIESHRIMNQDTFKTVDVSMFNVCSDRFNILTKFGTANKHNATFRLKCSAINRNRKFPKIFPKCCALPIHDASFNDILPLNSGVSSVNIKYMDGAHQPIVVPWQKAAKFADKISFTGRIRIGCYWVFYKLSHWKCKQHSFFFSICLRLTTYCSETLVLY